MRSFVLALQFLTVAMPAPRLDASARDMVHSRAWYGLVGAFLGLFLVVMAWLLSQLAPWLAVAAVLVGLWAAATRLLHLDGVADTADALGTTSDRGHALEIMKDLRIGAYGLGAVVCVLLVKFAAVASLPCPATLGALVAAPALARTLAGLLAALLPAARGQYGLGAAVHGLDPAGGGLWRDLLGAAAAVAAAVAACGAAGAWAALAVLGLGLVLAWWFQRRLGGVTGDTLGASIELGECAALLAVLAAT